MRKPSPRLAGVVESIPRVRMLADVGTDHAIVPIYACLHNICDYAIASDKNQGPLDIAWKNTARHGLGNRISFVLSDGLAHLSAGAVECIVIAGMGGSLIRRILRAASDVARGPLLVLQPQSDVCKLRKWLVLSGFDIAAERLMREGNRFYCVISAKASADVVPWSECEYFIGAKRLDERDHANLAASLATRSREIKRYLSCLSDDAAVGLAAQRLAWIQGFISESYLYETRKSCETQLQSC